MKKSKTVEVSVCDVCASEDKQVWVCAGCEKDCCARCCFVYRITRTRPTVFSSAMSTSHVVLPHQPDFSAVFCDGCGKSEAHANILRAGFRDVATGPKRVTSDNSSAVAPLN